MCYYHEKIGKSPSAGGGTKLSASEFSGKFINVKLRLPAARAHIKTSYSLFNKLA